MEELDEIKRYVANTYSKTDNEIDEIRDLVRRIDRQLNETDNQIDKIERFERTLNDIRSSISQLERRMR